MLEILRDQIDLAREQPVERLLKPGIKAVVLVAALSVAAHSLAERSARTGGMDTKGLAHLASKSSKPLREPSTTGATRRP